MNVAAAVRTAASLALCTSGVLGAQSADQTAIRKAREASNRAIAAHDTANIARHFMPDVHVVTSASALAGGRDENARRFAQQFADRPDVVYRRTPDSVAVFRPWGMAAEWGRWRGSWTDPDGKVQIGGRYFAKWQKVAEGWRIQSETYVPSYCRGGGYCTRSPR